jgi:hypothetical protein
MKNISGWTWVWIIALIISVARLIMAIMDYDKYGKELDKMGFSRDDDLETWEENNKNQINYIGNIMAIYGNLVYIFLVSVIIFILYKNS